MAGLALFCSINIVKETFFIIFDESDAYLDNDNTLRFLNFLQMRS